MQLILISNRLRTTKSLVLSARQLTFGAVSAALFVLFAATALTFFALQQIGGSDGAAVQDLLPSSARQPHLLTRSLSAKLDTMATKIGRMQAQTTILDLQSAALAARAGIKPHEFRLETLPGQGGPIPAASSKMLSMDDVEHVLDRMAVQIGNHADTLDVLESRVLDYTGQEQLLPRILPVRNPQIGSGFGMRTDPFTGQPAMHEGLDLVADVGTPIMAAGGGIVVFSGFHREFGNLVVIDHGNGVITRYGHCSRLDVKEGDVVLRGQVIAAVGDTGHATGPHLHFEVRYKGVAQNPSKFLQAGLLHPRNIARSQGLNPG
ncbi:MAG: M23 family metallopeptidase [Burkholderiales bacterium]|nr:M23 family metallopeptidase [Burkholderiales bacterium]